MIVRRMLDGWRRWKKWKEAKARRKNSGHSSCSCAGIFTERIGEIHFSFAFVSPRRNSALREEEEGEERFRWRGTRGWMAARPKEKEKLEEMIVGRDGDVHGIASSIGDGKENDKGKIRGLPSNRVSGCESSESREHCGGMQVATRGEAGRTTGWRNGTGTGKGEGRCGIGSHVPVTVLQVHKKRNFRLS